MYYVYALCNPFKKINHEKLEYEPFYIGRGKGNRMYEHFKTVQKIEKLDKTNNTYKNIILKKICDAGITPIYVKLAENLSVEEANKIEIFYIKEFGRKDLNEGCLGNLTNGGDGISDPGPETRLKMSLNNKNRKHNTIGITTYHLTLTKEELSLRGSKASLSRNGGVRKPPKIKKYPGLTRSEIARIREKNKTDSKKEEINNKISTTKRNQKREASNKLVLNNSKEEFFIFSLFSFGISVKNIQVLVFPQFSKDVVKNVVKRKYPNNTYRRQSKEEG